MNDSKIEIKTRGGVRLNYPNGFNISDEEKEAVDVAVQALENACGREIYGVYFNPDRDEEGLIHDIKIVFRKKI